MKKLLLTAITLLSFTVSTASATRAYATDGNGMQYEGLYTESSWLAIEVPLTAMNGTLPDDLTIAVSGLRDGTTITLDSVERQGDTALLYVTVARDDTSVLVNEVASIAVKSGEQVLTTVNIPVYGGVDMGN
ncbi:hypothetical protein GO986_11340 [Deinococcus sp. HMF7620]|uniref:Uncharacterized protein n=1 Tax=Deinococcus arboris TaxID=2682977 RepID=A0A7C9M291_9DEIO|nr:MULTISPECIES: hypothetical protein [Deinococcus]MBZ9751019.1 hypothetical protein [Deinococcus betulae]MVN87362.1 hypothetical protein [Deinococcus arboris]